MPDIITAQGAYGSVIQSSSIATTYTAVTVASSPVGNTIYQDINNCPNFVHVQPFSSASTGSPGFRIVGWRRYYNADNSVVWSPTVLADFAPSFGGTIPTGSINGTSYNFFSTVTQGSGTPSANLYSPGTGEIASVVVDVIGHAAVTVQFKAASAPTMGILWAYL
jgi:hypothetical protein